MSYKLCKVTPSAFHWICINNIILAAGGTGMMLALWATCSVVPTQCNFLVICIVLL